MTGARAGAGAAGPATRPAAAPGDPGHRLRVDVVDDAEAAAALVAGELAAVVAGRARGTGAAPRTVLGCPAGRTPRGAYAALGALAGAHDLDLSGVEIVMMDDYVEPGPGGYRPCPAGAHHSCRRAAEDELRAVLNGSLPPARQLPRRAVRFPDATDPGAYDGTIAGLGGIDLFLLASGASDGHVAFNPPGTAADSTTRIVELAESTRRDNLATFPAFRSLDDVPRHGVTVGLGTIARHARQVILLLTGVDKHESYRRVVGTSGFDPAWPATVVHRCRGARVVADRCAADGVTR